MSNDGERAVGAEEADAKADLSQAQTDSQTSTGAEADESHSDADGIFGETLKSLQKQVATLEKKQQSTKDKTLAAYGKDLSQVKEAVVNLTKLVQSGASSSQASRGNEEQDGASNLVQEMFVVAGIAPDAKSVENTPEYLNFFAANGGRVDMAKATSYLKTLRGGQAAVSAAAIAQPASGGAAKPDANALVQDYTKEMVAARGNPNELKRIKAKYKEQGVPVDNVGFTF